MKNRQSFYRALRKVAHLFKWNSSGRGSLRGYDEKGNCYCPITAVHFAITGEFVDTLHYDNCQLLPSNEASVIVGAADYCLTTQERKRAYNALIRAVGLPTYTH